MKRKSLTLIGFLAFSIFLLNKDFALGHTWKVHENVLSKKARELLEGKDVDKRYKEIWEKEQYGGYFDRTGNNNDDIKEGSGEEDNPKELIPDLSAEASVGSWMQHYYNPKTGDGLHLFKDWDPAIKYGETIWSEAIWKYRDGDKENAYYKLGRVLHLLEDMSSAQI